MLHSNMAEAVLPSLLALALAFALAALDLLVDSCYTLELLPSFIKDGDCPLSLSMLFCPCAPDGVLFNVC